MKRYILSLDGGGVRGGISCAFLEHLEQHLFMKRYQKTIQHVFEAIGGSSAGAITSSLLAVGTPITKISSELFSAEEMKYTFKRTWPSKIPGFGKIF